MKRDLGRHPLQDTVSACSSGSRAGVGLGVLWVGGHREATAWGVGRAHRACGRGDTVMACGWGGFHRPSRGGVGSLPPGAEAPRFPTARLSRPPQGPASSVTLGFPLTVARAGCRVPWAASPQLTICPLQLRRGAWSQLGASSGAPPPPTARTRVGWGSGMKEDRVQAGSRGLAASRVDSRV